MKKVAILVSDNLLPEGENRREDAFELEEQMGKLIPAFAALDMQVDQVRWRDAAEKASEYDAMLPLFVWDYFEGNEDAFIREMAKASRSTKLFNRFEKLTWNADKSYLDEMERAGAPVIKTVTLERVTQAGVAKAFEELGCEKVVIKPQIGGGAWRQVLYAKGDEFPDRGELPPEGALVQPFLPSVQSEGEYSFIYFGAGFLMPLSNARKTETTVFNRSMAARKRRMSRARESANRLERFWTLLILPRFMPGSTCCAAWTGDLN